MNFEQNEIAILLEEAKTGLPSKIGERCTVISEYFTPNYDYLVEFDDKSVNPVKASELGKVSEGDLFYMDFIFTRNKVLYNKIKQVVEILKVDYINRQAEIKDENGLESVVGFNSLTPIDYTEVEEEIVVEGKFTKLGLEIGKFTDSKDKQYGSSVDATYEMIKVLMERYKNEDNTYTIPESLLQHILLQVRIMDKQNRIFNNPEGKKDSESPYNDITGYGLIGINMVTKK